MQDNASARALTDDLERHASRMGIDLVGCTSASPFLLGEERREIVPRETMLDAHSVVVAACYVYGFEVHEPSEPGRPRGKFGPWTRASLAAAGYGERTIAEFLEARGYRAASPGDLPRKAAAVRAALSLAEQAARADATPSGPIPVGTAVHTGTAYVGGSGPVGVVEDFTALGDVVNATARLASAAGAGEVLVSVAAAAAAGIPRDGVERRTVGIRGRVEPIDVLVVRPTDVRG